jgi:uncharacterized membrane protein
MTFGCMVCCMMGVMCAPVDIIGALVFLGVGVLYAMLMYVVALLPKWSARRLKRAS